MQMSFSLTSPVTGGAQTGFTSPTYSLATDAAPSNTGKQYAVSAVGGTQAGVDVSSTPSRPFTITLSRPPVLRQLPPLNAATGLLPNVANNVYKVIVRKGVTVASGQTPRMASATVEIAVPAGADAADAPNIRAMLSLLIGSLNSISASIGDSVVTGVI
jgi:biotin carboxyl carrier protein